MYRVGVKIRVDVGWEMCARVSQNGRAEGGLYIHEKSACRLQDLNLSRCHCPSHPHLKASELKSLTGKS